ncbi:epimerase [Rhodoferax lacus]|uniref:Epimerase n=1 Tax=Rhodoferax lacus TaxID=2184758 RepID=A0A3E1R9T1_9BURK|nr:NAD-dependent epimerase/dehydratase family protein [Rhodoferax lacus]RFO96128.1 epimerase [Rhodoferax lacus]
MAETVLILGARGRFGLAAARAFADAGWQVLAHRRLGAKVPHEAAGDTRIEWLQADVHDTASLADAARALSQGRGIAVVVHALSPAYTDAAWKQQALPMAEAALDLCRVLDATLMLPGNIYNFGADMPEDLHEDTPQNARSIKGQIRIGMEEQLRRSGVRSIVLRAGNFFGSGKGTWFDQSIVKDIARGVFTYPGPLDVATAWAYLPDLAQTFVALAGKRAQLRPFEVLHFAGHSLTARQWLEVLTPLAQAQGWVPPGQGVHYKSLPWGLIRLGSWFVPTWAGLLELRYLWDRPHRLDNRALRALLGTEPHTALDVATGRALQDLGLMARGRLGSAAVREPMQGEGVNAARL